MQQVDWVAERTHALAIVYLTRRNDLSIRTQPESEWGVDMVVDIMPPGKKEERRFGVFLYGTRSRLTETESNKILTLKLRRWLTGRRFLHPVCLLLFSMNDDSGYYSWLAEPVTRQGGGVELRYPTRAISHKLDRAGLDQVVDAVNHWYDALYTPAAPEISSSETNRGHGPTKGPQSLPS